MRRFAAFPTYATGVFSSQIDTISASFPRKPKNHRHSGGSQNPVRSLQPNGCKSKNGGALRRENTFLDSGFRRNDEIEVATVAA
jgi:hypothetical protein